MQTFISQNASNISIRSTSVSSDLLLETHVEEFLNILGVLHAQQTKELWKDVLKSAD